MMEKEDIARKINYLEGKIKDFEEDLSLWEGKGKPQYAESVERDIKRLRLIICRLNGEELRGLSKDETGYERDAKICCNCEEFVGYRPECPARCRLLDDGDNFVSHDGHCDFWKEEEWAGH
jgi:hypothetical protein